jgi:hypothetical protein
MSQLGIPNIPFPGPRQPVPRPAGQGDGRDALIVRELSQIFQLGASAAVAGLNLATQAERHEQQLASARTSQFLENARLQAAQIDLNTAQARAEFKQTENILAVLQKDIALNELKDQSGWEALKGELTAEDLAEFQERFPLAGPRGDALLIKRQRELGAELWRSPEVQEEFATKIRDRIQSSRQSRDQVLSTPFVAEFLNGVAQERLGGELHASAGFMSRAWQEVNQERNRAIEERLDYEHKETMRSSLANAQDEIFKAIEYDVDPKFIESRVKHMQTELEGVEKGLGSMETITGWILEKFANDPNIPLPRIERWDKFFRSKGEFSHWMGPGRKNSLGQLVVRPDGTPGVAGKRELAHEALRLDRLMTDGASRLLDPKQMDMSGGGLAYIAQWDALIEDAENELVRSVNQFSRSPLAPAAEAMLVGPLRSQLERLKRQRADIAPQAAKVDTAEAILSKTPPTFTPEELDGKLLLGTIETGIKRIMSDVESQQETYRRGSSPVADAFAITARGAGGLGSMLSGWKEVQDEFWSRFTLNNDALGTSEGILGSGRLSTPEYVLFTQVNALVKDAGLAPAANMLRRHAPDGRAAALYARIRSDPELWDPVNKTIRIDAVMGPVFGRVLQEEADPARKALTAIVGQRTANYAISSKLINADLKANDPTAQIRAMDGVIGSYLAEAMPGFNPGDGEMFMFRSAYIRALGGKPGIWDPQTGSHIPAPDEEDQINAALEIARKETFSHLSPHPIAGRTYWVDDEELNLKNPAVFRRFRPIEALHRDLAERPLGTSTSSLIPPLFTSPFRILHPFTPRPFGDRGQLALAALTVRRGSTPILGTRFIFPTDLRAIPGALEALAARHENAFEMYMDRVVRAAGTMTHNGTMETGNRMPLTHDSLAFLKSMRESGAFDGRPDSDRIKASLDQLLEWQDRAVLIPVVSYDADGREVGRTVAIWFTDPDLIREHIYPVLDDPARDPLTSAAVLYDRLNAWKPRTQN